MKMQIAKRFLSILLCVTMIFTMLPGVSLTAFAAETDGLCDHHTEHTVECGYAAGSAGAPCAHVHNEDCYTILACVGGEAHECTVESGCITMERDCHHTHGDCGYSKGTAEVPCGHVHDENCGYVAAVQGTACGHSCADHGCTLNEDGETYICLHTEHDDTCGYVAPVEGQPCNHTEHTDCGYAPATESTPCTHVCEVRVNSADSCYKLLCSHKDGGHDDACGYAPAVEGHECHYECAECAIDPANDEPGDETPVCTCEAAEGETHTEGCALYVAPTEPVCTCAEGCTADSFNEYCEVCGVDYSKCTGTDTAVVYADCTCTVKCAEGSVNSECTVCATDSVVLADVCNGAENTSAQAAASITVDGTTTYYTTLAEAVAAVNEGQTIVLLDDVTYSQEITISKGTFCIDLGNKVVTCNGGNAFAIANSGGKVTFQNGTINSSLCCLSVTDGTVVVNNVTLTTTSNNTHAVYAHAGNSRTIKVILDGTVVNGLVYALYGAVVEITNSTVNAGIDLMALKAQIILGAGATFPGNLGTVAYEGMDYQTLSEMLGEGMAYWQNGKMLTSIDETTTAIDGEIVVKAICNHGDDAGQSYSDNGDGTHSLICECGAKISDITENHSGGTNTCEVLAQCEKCGASYGELAEHTFDSTTGECSTCQTDLATVRVEKGDTSAYCYYESLDDAIQAVANCTDEDKAIVELVKDINLAGNSQEITSGTFTIDLNNFKLESMNENVLYVKGGQVTIDDASPYLNGCIVGSTKNGVSVSGGTVNIERGTITGNENGVYVIGGYVTSQSAVSGGNSGIQINGGKAFISDGSVSGKSGVTVSAGNCEIVGGTITGTDSAVAVHNANMTITGGSISGTHCDIYYYEESSVTLALAENKNQGATFPNGLTIIKDSGMSAAITLNGILDAGAAYWQDGKMLTVADDATEITGTVTIREKCLHQDTSKFIYDIGNDSHTATCTLCGTDLAPEAHSGGTASCTEQAKCAKCGESYGALLEHTYDPATGLCSCDAQAVAAVGEQFFTAFADAAKAVTAANSTIRVFTDVTIAEGETVVFTIPVILEVAEGKTIVNNGTMKFPAAFALDDAPESGTVFIGEKSYNWNAEQEKWICTEGSHTFDMTAADGICTFCGTSCSHTSVDPSTGRCNACSFQHLLCATDEEASSIHYFTDLSAAVTSGYCNVDLLADITVSTAVTVPSGVLLNCAPVVNGTEFDIAFTDTGSLTNNGTVVLNKSYTYSTIPTQITGGTVTIGSNSYIWDTGDKKYLCAEGSHTFDPSTGICQVCGYECPHSERHYDSEKVALVCDCGFVLPAVASVTIGDRTEYYEDFNYALSAAGQGTSSSPATLTLLADVTLSSTPYFNCVFTLDLDGHDISASVFPTLFYQESGEITITDTSDSADGTIANTAGSIAYVYGEMILENGCLSGNVVVERSGTFTMNDGSVTHISCYGNSSTIINDGSIGSESVTHALLLSQNCKVTINGGTITGKYALCNNNKTESVTINAGELQGTVADFLWLASSKPVTVADPGDASYSLAIVSTIQLPWKIATTASGVIEPEWFTLVDEGNNIDEMDGTYLFITGDRKKADGTAWIEGGLASELYLCRCMHSSLDDGKCGDCGREFAATVTNGGVVYYYPTLSAAVEAINNSATYSSLTLLKDAAGDIQLPSNIKVDGGGHTLKGSITFTGERWADLENITVDSTSVAIIANYGVIFSKNVVLNGIKADIQLSGDAYISYCMPQDLPKYPYTVIYPELPVGGTVRVLILDYETSPDEYPDPKDIVTSSMGVISVKSDTHVYLSHIIKSVKMKLGSTVVSDGTAVYNGSEATLTITDYTGSDVTDDCSVTWTNLADNTTITTAPSQAGNYQYTATFVPDFSLTSVTFTGTLTIVNPSGQCGDNAYWEFDPETGKLTISGTGAMYDYYWKNDGDLTASPWYDYRSSITSITVENGITQIGNYAFYDSQASSISLPESLTEIGNGVFELCTVLTGIDLPGKLEKVGVDAFQGCAGITSITFPNSVQEIGGGALAGCTKITSVTLPANENYIALEEALFFGCKALKEVTIPESIANIGTSAFSESAVATVHMTGDAPTVGEGAFVTNDDVTIYVYGTNATGYENGVWKDAVTVVYVDKLTSMESIAEQTYTGSEICPAVVVKNYKGEVIDDSNYSVAYSENVHAGTATVTVTGTGETYGGTLTANFTISKAAGQTLSANLSVSNNYANTYSIDLSGYVPAFGTWGDSSQLGYALGTVTLGTYYTDGAKVEGTTLILPINAVESSAEGSIGTVTVKISSQNFEESTWIFTVNRINHTHDWSYSVNDNAITATCSGTICTCPDKTVTITLAAPTDLTYDGSEKTVAVTQSPAGVFADLPAVSYSGNCKDAGTYTATLTYGEVTASVDFTIEKAAPAVAWATTTETVTYTGSAAAITAPVVTLVNGESFNGTIKYSYTGTSSGDGLPTNAGTYEITASIPAQGNYAAATSTNKLALTITSRSITVTPEDQTVLYGSTLSGTEVTADNLVKGQTVIATLTPSTTNVTVSGTITASNPVITENGRDVTGNYTITIGGPAKLVILPNTSKIDGLTTETVTSANKADIEAVQEMMENADKTGADAQTLADWAAIEENCEDLLEALEEAHDALDTENTEKVEDVTSGNVQPEDRDALEKAKADLEKALEDNAGNYTEAEKQSIEDEIKRMEDALTALENAEDVTDVITQLPDTVKPDDVEAAEKILNAKEAYDGLTDHEKSLVDDATRKKLDDLVAALTAYDIIEGDGGKWTRGSSYGLSFTANGPFSKFVGIEVDGREVDAKYYDAKSGSTVITLKQSFLKKLSTGEHTITVLYTDGETSGTFKILSASSTPATGDDSNVALWSAVLCTSALGMAALLIGSKKKRSTK